MNLIILLLIIGGIIYFFYQKKNHATLSDADKERLTYFDKKYQKQLVYVNTSFDRIQKLTELSFDLLNIHLVKLLVEENPDRYDAISARHQAGSSKTDEYEEWIVESKNQKIIKLRQSKTLMSECKSALVDIFQMWEKAVNKHIKSHTEQGLEFYLDDMKVPAYILTPFILV